MPTGYTSKIKEGYTFKEYAMDCARAFGALVDMRDYQDMEIPTEILPSEFYYDSVTRSKAKLKDLEAVSGDDITAQYYESQEDRSKECLSIIEKNNKQRLLYVKMIADVEAYVPPTADHRNHKDFMLEQINMCMEETDNSYWNSGTNRPNSTNEDILKWHEKRIEAARQSIANDEKYLQEEIDRCATRTKWICGLTEAVNKHQASISKESKSV